MSGGLEARACEACGHVVYPARVLCPCCASPRFRAVVLTEAAVAEVTVRRGRDPGALELVRLVSVTTDAGPTITARALDELEPGARVRLDAEGGAPVVRRA